ncbi:MAG: hypothetical protein B6242_10040 [Anaerolineaceae bacterium 4572_78]|nr:MAG: hypothetical protein B6242_10040 [Anaerolineaceae bacterium 4572_78]
MEFTKEEIEYLRDISMNHTDPKIRKRAWTVYLKSLKYSHKEIGHIVGLSQKTLRRYLQAHQDKGCASFRERKSLYTPKQVGGVCRGNKGGV